MDVTSTRRDFLGILIGGAAGLAWPRAASGQTPSAAGSPIAATPLTDNLIHFSGAGGNVVVAIGPDGLLLVNGGAQERSADLLGAIAERTGGKRIQSLFNTDWHREHTGSNEALGRAGTTIIAHEHTRQYLGTEIYVDWQKRSYKPLPPQALPGQTFYTSGRMTAGAERVEYGHLGQAHTDAAIYVFFPVSNVLVAGDALSVGRYPIPDYTTGGWLGGLIAANKTLIALANADTRIVPGAGPIQTRADLQAQHDMLAAMLDRFAKMMKQGQGPEDIMAAAATRELTKELEPKWGSPDLFVSTAYRSMWLHVRELGGIV
ncbi:MAG: MBL fold metallo-hydrolase [Acidobacteriota bacterium]